MPQMAPLSWTILFASFIVIYLMNTSKIYFSSSPLIKSMKNKEMKNKNLLVWKW